MSVNITKIKVHTKKYFYNKKFGSNLNKNKYLKLDYMRMNIAFLFEILTCKHIFIRNYKCALDTIVSDIYTGNCS